MGTPPPLPLKPPPSPAPEGPEDIRVGPVFRDIVLVFVLTAAGGCIVGAWKSSTSADARTAVIALGISNLLTGTIAFTIAGCLAPRRRWPHLATVAAGSWMLNFLTVILFGYTVMQWLSTSIWVAMVMGLGGAISYLWRPKDRVV